MQSKYILKSNNLLQKNEDTRTAGIVRLAEQKYKILMFDDGSLIRVIRKSEFLLQLAVIKPREEGKDWRSIIKP